MNPLILLAKTETSLGKTIVAITIGLLAGLFIIGKLSKNRKGTSGGVIKVSGKDYPDLVSRLKNKYLKKVDFKYVDLLHYEDVVEWIKSVEISDSIDDLGCLVVRGANKLGEFNIDTSSLSDTQKESFLALFVINTKTRKVFAEKYYIADALDEDLHSVLGENDSVIIK